MEQTVHEKLIAELFDDRNAMTPREIAARNEIQALREKLAEKAPKKAKNERKETDARTD